MRALHWGAERVFLMLSLAVVPFMPPSWPARTFLNEKREEGGGMMLCFARYPRRGGGLLHVVDSPLVFFSFQLLTIYLP